MTDPQPVETLARALAEHYFDGRIADHSDPCEVYVWSDRDEAHRKAWIDSPITRALLAEIAPQIRADAMEEAARVAEATDADYFRTRYHAEYNRKRYDIAGVERTRDRALNILAEDIAAAIRERARG